MAKLIIGMAFEVEEGEGTRLRAVLRRFHETSAAADRRAQGTRATQGYWRDWIGRFDVQTDWPEAVRRLR